MKFNLVLVVLALLALAANFVNASNDSALFAQMREKLQIALSTANVGDNACGFETENWAKLSGTTNSGMDNANKYKYSVTMCADNNTCKGSICQTDTSTPDGETNSLGTFTNTAGVDMKWVNPDNHASGVLATFTNGGSCGSFGGKRTTHLYMVCGTSMAIKPEESSQCTYEVNYSHPLFCNGGKGHTTPDSGLSGGSIFLIVLMSVSIVYVVAGCIICWKKYDKRGLDACPHKAFWFSLPGLIKDGFKFTYGKLRNCCGSRTITTSSGDYESA